jgi:hypothetical protein
MKLLTAPNITEFGFKFLRLDRNLEYNNNNNNNNNVDSLYNRLKRNYNYRCHRLKHLKLFILPHVVRACVFVCVCGVCDVCVGPHVLQSIIGIEAGCFPKEL